LATIWGWGKKHKKSETSCILIMAVNINRTNLSRRIMFLNNGQQLDRAKSSRLEKFTGGNLFAKTMEDQKISQKPRASEKLQRGRLPKRVVVLAGMLPTRLAEILRQRPHPA
jgi:hypothetical protein